MKPGTQLWIRKRALMLLRAIVWHLDEWIHAQETKLREEIARSQEPARAYPVVVHARERSAERPPAAKKRRRRGVTAAAFDLRFQP